MSDKTEKTKRRWESIYQGSPLEELPWEEGKPSAELAALIESGVVERGAVLDICCGSGSNAVYLAKKGFTCYGIDISPTVIGYAQAKTVTEGVSCELTVGDVVQLPYPDDMFTLVFDRGCFHSISPQDRKAYISGIHRVLKPAGKYQLLCFSSKDHCWYGPPYSFSSKDIRHCFSHLFKIYYIRELTHEAEGIRHYFLSVLMEKPS